MMRFERGNAVVAIEQIDGLGKRPGLWIGTKEPNELVKVAAFGSEDKAQTFCKWLEYMCGLSSEEPKQKGDGNEPE